MTDLEAIADMKSMMPDLVTSGFDYSGFDLGSACQDIQLTEFQRECCFYCHMRDYWIEKNVQMSQELHDHVFTGE